MPFRLLRGTLHVRNYQPDGDTIRFKPDRPELAAGLPGATYKTLNARGHASLRLEAMDALETHYTPQDVGGSYKQPPAHAHSARTALLKFADITQVTWSADGRTVVDAKDGTRGYILTREVEKYGRIVAFLFPGDPAEADGSSVMLDPARCLKSFNALALKEGVAYPTFYTGLFADLRDTLSELALAARDANSGLYGDDVTGTGFDVASIDALTDRYVILPKLFRRLVQYVASTGSAVGFKETLALAQEPVLDLRTSNFTHLDTFIEQAPGSTRLRLTRSPEELVFGPMADRPGDPFGQVLAAAGAAALRGAAGFGAAARAGGGGARTSSVMP